MANKDSFVDVCNTCVEAEYVVGQLRTSGFDATKLSIVGKSQHDDTRVIGCYNTGNGMKHWGEAGTFWNGLWGTPSGSAFFLVPGIGPVLVAGPLVAAIAGALEQTAVVGGLNALGVGLYNLGIPQNSVMTYEAALRQEKFLVIAHGTAEEIAKARNILGSTKSRMAP